VAEKPYRWDQDHPAVSVARPQLLGPLLEDVRAGRAVRLVGGRGMGKSVLLEQLREELASDASVRAVLVPGPPEAFTVTACVEALGVSLWGERTTGILFDDLVIRPQDEHVGLLVLLFDEVEQYVSRAAGAPNDGLGRRWFNFLETRRKNLRGFLGIVAAGGVGLLYLERALGSSLVSRASSVLLTPFDRDELRRLAEPFERDGRALNEPILATILALSGGNPALATYALEHAWTEPSPRVEHIQAAFAAFRAKNGAFVRDVWRSICEPAVLDAPGRVLDVVRARAGVVPRAELLGACEPRGESVRIELQQALQILGAAGFVAMEGSDAADPVLVHAVSSVLNLPERPASEGDPVERLLADVAAVLGQLHRFGRDFHGDRDLLREEVFSSVLAVGLVLLGWQETDREAVQKGGYTDVRVRLRQPGMTGHVVLEVKLWGRNDYETIQRQLDDYWVSDTLHGVAVMLGKRDSVGWNRDYEQACLPPGDFLALETPQDLVGRWRVELPDGSGAPRRTDHFLVQLPKRV
jgi:hypothetical protein